jgi:hypothetical protein
MFVWYQNNVGITKLKTRKTQRKKANNETSAINCSVHMKTHETMVGTFSTGFTLVALKCFCLQRKSSCQSKGDACGGG